MSLLSDDVLADDFMISEAIMEVTPGGMSFQPGKITESQQEWRNSRPTQARNDLISDLKAQVTPQETK